MPRRRVLIYDPDPTIARLLARMLERLGYEPVALRVASRVAPCVASRTHHHTRGARPTPALLRSADVLLIEPAAPGALALARTARAASPGIAILGEGAAVAPTPPRSGRDDRGDPWRRLAAPVGHLAKPFTRAQLDAALQQSIAHGDRLRRGRTRLYL